MVLDFLKRKDGTWDIGLIMSIVVAVVAVVGTGYAMYYMTSRTKKRPFDDIMRDVRTIHQAGGPMPDALKPYERFDTMDVTPWQGHTAHTGMNERGRALVEARYGIQLPSDHIRPSGPPAYDDLFPASGSSGSSGPEFPPGLTSSSGSS